MGKGHEKKGEKRKRTKEQLSKMTRQPSRLSWKIEDLSNGSNTVVAEGLEQRTSWNKEAKKTWSNNDPKDEEHRKNSMRQTKRKRDSFKEKETRETKKYTILESERWFEEEVSVIF